MSGYREVFKPEPDAPRGPGRIFYTLTPEDVGKRIIKTTAGPVNVGDVIGAVLPIDIGKRLYHVPNEAGDMWIWQCESNDQRDARLARAALDT